jgi:hypothetical protein
MNLPVDQPFGEASAKDSQETIHRRAAARKRLDEVFGDVLPTVTQDERGDGADGPPRATDRDQWYRDNRPPHHE